MFVIFLIVALISIGLLFWVFEAYFRGGGRKDK
jgi:uncharacterized protein HemY